MRSVRLSVGALGILCLATAARFCWSKTKATAADRRRHAGAGGPALAERLQAKRLDMKVLYTTGYIDDDVAHHGMLQPGVAVLEKPFTLDALLEAVQVQLSVKVR